MNDAKPLKHGTEGRTMRLIDIDALYTEVLYDLDYDYVDAVRLSTIENAPIIDAMPVAHGNWIVPTVIGGRAFNIPHCSVCNGVPCGVNKDTKYCPNCGAKMDGCSDEE